MDTVAARDLILLGYVLRGAQTEVIADMAMAEVIEKLGPVGTGYDARALYAVAANALHRMHQRLGAAKVARHEPTLREMGAYAL